MDHRRLSEQEVKTLGRALHGNADRGLAILVGKDTSFAGTAEDVSDEEVVNAVKSVPTHY